MSGMTQPINFIHKNTTHMGCKPPVLRDPNDASHGKNEKCDQSVEICSGQWTLMSACHCSDFINPTLL